MYLWSFMILNVSFLELSFRNHFTVSSHRDLDLWPSDLEIKRGHLQIMINVHIKFHDHRRTLSWVIIPKPFYWFESPLPWPSDLKINRGHQWVIINVPTKFHDPTRKRSWVIIWKPSGGRTDRRPTYRHAQNNIPPLLRKGGIKICAYLTSHLHLTKMLKSVIYIRMHWIL